MSMSPELYKSTKLEIFERAHDGSISESVRDQMLLALEAKKDEDKVSAEDAVDFLRNLKDSYPDLEDDIDALMDKIDGSDDKSDDKDDDDKDEDEEEEDVEESFDDIFDILGD